MEEESTKFTILMFPWLAVSHVYPFFELSKRLSSRNFHVYFCSSSPNLDSVKETLQKDSIFAASIELVELKVPSSPDLPLPFHSTKNLPPSLMPALMKAFQGSTSSFSEILTALKPDLLIYDFFQPWAAKLALSQGIPSVYFATSGAAAFSFFHHMFTKRDTCRHPFQELYLLEQEKANLSAGYKPEIEGDDGDFPFGNFYLSTEIVLIKESKGIGKKYADYLSVLVGKKVVPTGLLVPDLKAINEENSILRWLDDQKQFSTLFICFGSEHFISKDQIHEIAKGLELSGVNFVWVLKFTPEDEKTGTLKEALPEGFLERVGGNGLVVEGWAPQARILSHSSIGAFASHCGWSSMTESWFFGVPVVAMPVKYDQPLNARLAVEMGVGVEVLKGENGVFSAEEIAKAVSAVLVEEKGEDLRCKARKLIDEIKKEEEETVDEVADEILRLCLKKRSNN